MSSARGGWAATLGAALQRAGHQIVGVSAISDAQPAPRGAAAARRRRSLPADEVVAAADFVLLAVPDDALRPLVAGLADTGVWRAGQLVAHTSGAQGIAVLDPAAARGVLAARAAPGDDLHRPPRGPRPAATARRSA